MNIMSTRVAFLLLVFVICSRIHFAYSSKSSPVKLDQSNWQSMLEGEWLVAFYAPWCPACKQLLPIWEHVAGWSRDLDFQTGQIDITENAGLSGRFLVTSLPTVFHVKDGEFRKYSGSRSENELINYIEEKKWKDIDPISWFWNPATYHMGFISSFFDAAMSLRMAHTHMTDSYGLPSWLSYLIFALVTIAIGLILGMILVCLCDYVCPGKIHKQFHSHSHSHGQQQGKNPNQYDTNDRGDHFVSKEEDDESDIVEDDRVSKDVRRRKGNKDSP